jgi:serine/threonine protein kinase/tetratricopeptide (TPR) repeat protein
MIGQALSHYQILEKLGEGGMGVVYKARDSHLDRLVAIKVLPAERVAHADSKRRFVQEAKAASALNHPNIVTIYDIDQASGVYFIAMEFVAGTPLDRLIPRQGLELNTMLKYGIQVADALAAAHAAGIVHRDLKPANLMVTDRGLVKVLDFGLAKLAEGPAIGESDDTETLVAALAKTEEGVILGTVSYMSPEQAEGKPVDARSDIFSLGSVLYEMVTGRKAFQGESKVSTLTAILRDEPKSAREIVTGLPKDVERIVSRCLRKEMSRRFQSMDDVRVELQDLKEDSDSSRLLAAPSSAALNQAARAVVKEAPSIAVLPFASMSSDAENEYFSDGISEEIINALGQVEGLHVAARTSSFSFKGKSVEVAEIARRLDVRHVLEGSVRRAGARVRVMAQLVDASNGFHLWSERYDRQIADIFDVQDEIARAIVERLKVAFDAGATSRLVKVATNNMEAYQEYLRGRAMLYRRGPWIARALESFQKAVALDPAYAQAWAGVADAYTALSYYGYRRPDEAMPAAVEAATRATVADPESAEAHNALAIAALLWERDFGKAEREFHEALALNPGYIQARCWYGLFFLQWGVGRCEDGLAEAWHAFEADPLSAYVTTVLSLALAAVQRFDEAVLQALNAVQHDPQSFLARWELGFAYHWNAQHEEAVAVLEPLWANSGHNWVAMGLVPAYVRAGREDQARSVYQSLLARQAGEYVQPFVLAVSATALGDHDAAIGFCEAAIEGRDMLFALMNRWWPDFERVRTDRRYGDLLLRFNSRGRTPP